MNAMQPWEGSYGSISVDGSFTVGPMVWATAHTTQFSQPGWNYLLTGTGAGTGSGMLSQGGSYVTLKNFTSGDFTIVIEKLSRNYSSCVRPYLPTYDTSDETATFTLGGNLKSVTQLYLWHTHWAHYPGDTTVEFQQMTPVPVVNGQFTLTVTVDSIYTLTTLNTGNKGSYPTPPVPTLFPASYTDDFEACPISSEAAYFAGE
jgi:galactosylceramidase